MFQREKVRNVIFSINKTWKGMCCLSWSEDSVSALLCDPKGPRQQHLLSERDTRGMQPAGSQMLVVMNGAAGGRRLRFLVIKDDSGAAGGQRCEPRS